MILAFCVVLLVKIASRVKTSAMIKLVTTTILAVSLLIAMVYFSSFSLGTRMKLESMYSRVQPVGFFANLTSTKLKNARQKGQDFAHLSLVEAQQSAIVHRRVSSHFLLCFPLLPCCVIDTTSSVLSFPNSGIWHRQQLQ